MVLLAWLLSLLLLVHGRHAGSKRQGVSDGHWLTTWAAMPQLTETSNLPPAPFTTSSSVFNSATIRQTIHISVGGEYFRLRISNAFGTTDLPITAVTLALPTNNTAGLNSIQANTLQSVTFSGSSSFTIPNGALAVSDAIRLPVQAQGMVAVTVYLARGQQGNNITSHPGSRTTSWMVQGNQVNATTLSGGNIQSVAHWYFLSALEVWAAKSTSTIAIVGDSITDGRGSDTDKNNRWPDLVLAKLQNSSSTSGIAVINQAAGGNRVLADGLGPNALGRIDRDVLSQPGVKYALIFEGVNDIGSAATTAAVQQDIGDRLISAFKQISTRVHAVGIPLFGATITPFNAPGGATQQPYSDPERERTRQRVNAFIRDSGGVFDAVVDFDQILRNGSQQDQLDARYNSGDYLHPNVAGYQAIGNAFPAEIFAQFAGGVQDPPTF